MLKHRCLCLAVAVFLVITSVNNAYGLIHLNFDEDVFAAPIGIPFVKITATISLDGQHYLFGGTGYGSTTAVYATPSFSLGPDPAETNSSLQQEKFKSQIGDLPGLVPDTNVPIDIPVVWGYWHLDNWDIESAAGYPGYINASGWFETNGISDTYSVQFYDPSDPGSMVDDPLLPDTINPNGGFEFAFDLAETGVGRNFPLFVDPDVATGYNYSVGLDDPNFALVYIPEPLPLGDSEFELHIDGEVYTLTAGVPFDITQIIPEGVRQFSIQGIDPSEGLDPSDPTAFVTGLMFVGGGEAINLTMTPVPEPSTLLLLSLGAFAVLISNKRRSK